MLSSYLVYCELIASCLFHGLYDVNITLAGIQRLQKAVQLCFVGMTTHFWQFHHASEVLQACLLGAWSMFLFLRAFVILFG